MIAATHERKLLGAGHKRCDWLRRDHSRNRTHTNALFGATVPLELDGTVSRGKKGIVATTADIGSWIDARAALADNDGAGAHKLTIKALDSQHFGLAVAAIARTAYTLFMCHL
jgi:hypothetical protein